MKPVRWIALSAALCSAIAPGLFARLSSAEDGLWQTDFKAAQAKAKAEKKYLLVDFTGSDWCSWCIKLHKEVFDKEPFKTEAPKRYVLMEADFPIQKKQSDELKKQNKELQDKYQVQGYPRVLLMDANGRVIAQTGYRAGGPGKYLQGLAEFPAIYENVAAWKAKLDKAEGLDRAKLLDQIIVGYKKLGNESQDVEKWGKEIVALDPDNKAGLRLKYGDFPKALHEVRKLAQTGKFGDAGKAADAALAMPGISAEMRQEAYLVKFQIAVGEKKFAAAVAALEAAKEAAPESEMCEQIGNMISMFRNVAEDQAAADKLKAEADKAKGLDRAKLLDKLVEARKKLAMYIPISHDETVKWSREIVALDADGKGGLKKKYEKFAQPDKSKKAAADDEE
jgi:thioredoxin-related protein